MCVFIPRFDEEVESCGEVWLNEGMWSSGNKLGGNLARPTCSDSSLVSLDLQKRGHFFLPGIGWATFKWRSLDLPQRKTREIFYGLFQGRRAGKGQKDLPASAVFSNANLPNFGVVFPEPHQSLRGWGFTQGWVAALYQVFQTAEVSYRVLIQNSYHAWACHPAPIRPVQLLLLLTLA